LINIGHGVCSKTLASSSRLGKSYTMFFCSPGIGKTYSGLTAKSGGLPLLHL